MFIIVSLALVLLVLVVAILAYTRVISGDWFITSIVLSLFAMSGFMAILTTTTVVDGPPIPNKKQEISALGNTTGVSGSLRSSFFMASGVIEDKQIFQYVKKSKKGYSELKKIDAEKVRIFEDESKKPYYIAYYSQESFPDWLGIDFMEWSLEKKYLYTEFHIPSGSIQNSYDIDISSK